METWTSLPQRSRWGNPSDQLEDLNLSFPESQALHAAILHGHGTPAMLVLARRLYFRFLLEIDIDWKEEVLIDTDVQNAIHENGQIPGMCILADYFVIGLAVGGAGVGQNFELAADLYRRDVLAYGCNNARRKLADMYRSGSGVSRDESVAVALHEDWFEETRSPLAAKRLANLLDCDPSLDDLQQDWRRAVTLYEYAIESSADMEALEDLVHIYWYGREGLPADSVKAFELYEKYELSERKPLYSQRVKAAARMCWTGTDDRFEADAPRAVQLYERAIELDPQNADARGSLAELLNDGAVGLPRDAKRAEACFRKAADLGDTRAKYLLAHLAWCGYEGVNPDQFRVMALCDELIAEAGDNLLTKLRIAEILIFTDNDLGASRLNAAQYLEEILQADWGDAGFNLDLLSRALLVFGKLLVTGGAGLDVDRTRGIELLELAISEHDNPKAMRFLAILISDPGREHDIPRGIKLSEMALERGEDFAIFLADLLTNTSLGAPADLERGIQLYEELIREYEEMEAMVNLASVLSEVGGDVGVRDIPRAIELYEQAIAQALRNDKGTLSELGIEPKQNDNLRISRNAHIASKLVKENIEERHHLIAMCHLADLLVREAPENNIKRAMLLFEIAMRDARASETFQEEPFYGEWTTAGRIIFNDMFYESLEEIYEYVKDDEDLCRKAVGVFEMITARTGSTKAMCLLAELLLEGAAGIPRDTKKAISLYQRAIFKGDTSAMLALGELVSFGAAEVHIDRKYAVELFTRVVRAEKEGVVMRSAIVNLAYLFEHRRLKILERGT